MTRTICSASEKYKASYSFQLFIVLNCGLLKNKHEATCILKWLEGGGGEVRKSKIFTLGMAGMPRWSCQRRTTCAVDRP